MTLHPDDPGSAYEPQNAMLVEARQFPEIWRFLAGLVVVSATVVGLNAVLFGIVASFGTPGWTATFLTGVTPVSLLLVLFSFAFIFVGVAVAARLMQHRSLASVLGQTLPAIKQFWRVLRALVLLSLVVLVLPPYDMGFPLIPNLDWSTWAMLLPVSVLAVLIQTGAEEVLFRGYMQQSLAARFRSPLIWIGLPSVLFALGHYAPSSAGDNAMLITIWAFAFGLLTADLTARSGTLGPAIALHFMNNFTALLVVSLPDGLSGLALYHLPHNMSDAQALRPWLYVDFAIMLVGWLTARLALKR